MFPIPVRLYVQKYIVFICDLTIDLTSFMSPYSIEDRDSPCSTNIKQLDADADRFLTGWMYNNSAE